MECVIVLRYKISFDFFTLENYSKDMLSNETKCAPKLINIFTNYYLKGSVFAWMLTNG